MESPKIEHEVYINTPPEKVFEAITTSKGWDSWFTNGTTIELKPGGEIKLKWKDFGAGNYNTVDGGPILEVAKNRRIAFQWFPTGHPTTVTFSLEPKGSGTLVKLTETGYKPTKDDIDTCIGCAVGWGEALTLLKFYSEHNVTYGDVPR